jgi:hypothetical protein
MAKKPALTDIAIRKGQFRMVLHKRSHAQVQFDCDEETKIRCPKGLFADAPDGKVTLPAGKSSLTLDPQTPASDFIIRGPVRRPKQPKPPTGPPNLPITLSD